MGISKNIVEFAEKLADALLSVYGKEKDNLERVRRATMAISDALVEFPGYDTLVARINSELRGVDSKCLGEILEASRKFVDIREPTFYLRLAINLPYLVSLYVRVKGSESVERKGEQL